MYKTNRELLTFLQENIEARNDYKKGWITFVTKDIENPFEKAVLEKYLPILMPESTYRREVALIQNTLWICEPSDEVIEKRQRHRRKKQNFFWRFKELFI